MNAAIQTLAKDEKAMRSLKYSWVHTNLAGMLFNDERFTTFIELSLDTSDIDLSQFGLTAKDELVPDVCLYLDPLPLQAIFRQGVKK